MKKHAPPDTDNETGMAAAAVPGAPNFTWAELCASPTARRLGLANTPGPAGIYRLGVVCAGLAQPARTALGPITVGSGYRSPALNRAVGGAARSAHLYGAALDLTPRSVNCRELTLWLSVNAPCWDQIIWERRADGRRWVHVALWPPGERTNRGMLLAQGPVGGLQPITPAWLSAAP